MAARSRCAEIPCPQVAHTRRVRLFSQTASRSRSTSANRPTAGAYSGVSGQPGPRVAARRRWWRPLGSGPVTPPRTCPRRTDRRRLSTAAPVRAADGRRTPSAPTSASAARQARSGRGQVGIVGGASCGFGPRGTPGCQRRWSNAAAACAASSSNVSFRGRVDGCPETEYGPARRLGQRRRRPRLCWPRAAAFTADAARLRRSTPVDVCVLPRVR